MVLNFSMGFKNNAAATAECLFNATPLTNTGNLFYRKVRCFYSADGVFFSGLSFLDFGLRIDSPVNVKR